MKKIFYTFSLSLAALARQAENSPPTNKTENLKSGYSTSVSKNDLVIPPDKSGWVIFALTRGGFSGTEKAICLVSNGYLSEGTARSQISKWIGIIRPKIKSAKIF